MPDLLGGDSTPPAEPTLKTDPNDIMNVTYPESFPEEFHGNPSIMKFYDKESKEFNTGNLMTSYLHAQKMIGGKRLAVPTADSTEEDWNNVFKTLGLPERDQYNLGIEGVDETADDMTKGFIDVAHKLGVLPNQAKGIVEYFNEAQKGQETQMSEDEAAKASQALENLKKEWHGSFEDNVGLANQAIETFFTEEQQAAAKEAGYFADPLFVKLMHTMSGKLMDDNTLSGTSPRIGGFEGEQSLRDEYHTVFEKMKKPEFKNSTALNQRLTRVLEQAAKKGVKLY